MSYFAKQLKTLRTQKNWSMQELSDSAGVSKSMICKIENEEVQPTIDVAARLAKALKVTISEMLHSTNEDEVIHLK
jgi:transcriptional regulator with XRE-family HTH domain